MSFHIIFVTNLSATKTHYTVSVIGIVSIIYTEIHEEFNKTNRFWIAHTEQQICAIKRTRVFYVDKTCFPKPGHKLCLYGISQQIFSPK